VYPLRLVESAHRRGQLRLLRRLRPLPAQRHPHRPQQANCNKPVAANFMFYNLYFANDGFVVNANDY
jgi:hypothetical protein